ncbi:MAG: ArnT family glycosyltransferase [Cyclobacteriaceae bacterium]
MNTSNELKLKRTESTFILVFLALYILSLFSHLNVIPLSFEEPRRAEVALEMMSSGNYIVPTLNETLYFNKPPLYNWLLVGLFHVTGSQSEWVVRLPTVLSLLLLACLHFVFIRKLVNPTVALLSAIMLLTTADIYYYFSLYGEIDMFYTLLVYCQIMAIFWFYQKQQFFLLFLVSYIFMSAGVLTKGMPSLAFQALTLLGLAIWQRQFRLLFSWQHIFGLIVGFGIIVLYFNAYASYTDPIPFLARLFTESADRSVSSKPFPLNLVHLVGFPFMIIKIGLPWFLFAIVFIKKETRGILLQNRFLVFSMTFIIANLWIYWLSPGTRERYLYMFFTFVFTIIASGFTNINIKNFKLLQWLDTFFTVLSIILAVGFLVIPWINLERELPHLKFALPALSVAMFIVLYCKKYMPGSMRIVWIALIMVVVRMAFNYTVIPHRKLSSLERKPFQVNAEAISQITQGNHVFALARVESKEAVLRIPMVKTWKSNYDEVIWPDFELSYYLAQSTANIWKYKQEVEADNYYLAEKTLLPKRELEILHEFYVPKNNRTYVLFRVEENSSNN